MKSAVIIMAKAPVAGTVKTRLGPFLSGKQCAALAAHFLLDAVRKTENLDAGRMIAYAPPGGRSFFSDVIDEREITLFEQRGNDLGEKIRSAFGFAFEQGFDSVVMIGTDSPTVPAQFIERGIEFLNTRAAEAVLGRTLDGGFYLVGLRRRPARPETNWPKEIFENVEWSTPETFSQTKGNISRLKLNLKLLPDWYDVDGPDDLRRLKEEFESDASAREAAPNTFAWMRRRRNVWERLARVGDAGEKNKNRAFND